MSLAFRVEPARRVAEGWLVAVPLPAVPRGVAAPALDEADAARLGQALRSLGPQAEAAVASAGLRRCCAFVGGRLALSAALEAAGARPGYTSLPDDRGAPSMPAGYVGSIAHKDRLAVALASVAPADEARLGLDLELLAPARPRIARHALTAEERAIWPAVAGEPPAAPWPAVAATFAAKEALYKALDPFVRRYVGFQEVRWAPDWARWRAGPADRPLAGPFPVLPSEVSGSLRAGARVERIATPHEGSAWVAVARCGPSRSARGTSPPVVGTL